MIRMERATSGKTCKFLPVFTTGAILFLLCSFTLSCAPTVMPVRPPENYRGPIAEGPILQAEDYWIYRRADGSRVKVGAGTLLSKVEFPLWMGRVWKYQSTASRIGHPVTGHGTSAEIECEAAAFKAVTVAAGSFEAFECKCRCTVRVTGVYDPDCGQWTVWYAPQAKNIVKIKTESTASSVELLEYKVSDKVQSRVPLKKRLSPGRTPRPRLLPTSVETATVRGETTTLRYESITMRSG